MKSNPPLTKKRRLGA